MNRQHFLKAVVSLIPMGSLADASAFKPDVKTETKIPPYLRKGDVIGITCPSGFITLEEIQPAVNKMKEWGFEVRVGRTVGLKDFTFAGTDEERLNDLQNMLDDPSIKAIMLGRGGYGAVRIIDDIDFEKFSAEPKWIIGFSDATVIHCHLNRNYGIASIHSKMCNSFPDDWSLAEQTQIDSIDSIRKCLSGDKMIYRPPCNEKNRNGKGEGFLIGGNLSIIENLAATKSEINTAGKILFLEEVGEYLYNIDRMLWNLKRSGKFDKLHGLVIGSIKNKPDDMGEEFGESVCDMVLEKVKEYNYPVCFNFPVGHQKENYALKCTMKHKLHVSRDDVYLKEM